MPMPSPSMKGMIGWSGTLSEASGLMVILRPVARHHDVLVLHQCSPTVLRTESMIAAVS